PATGGALVWPAFFKGTFSGGLRHGPGMLTIGGVSPGMWRGWWFRGLQHGVHLWITSPSGVSDVRDLQKALVESGEVTAWIFDRGVKGREATEEEASAPRTQWKALCEEMRKEHQVQEASKKAAATREALSAAETRGGKGE
ncbi:unnamed protein product, partial [Discosporangium mesarthrocarpum]